MHIPVGILTFFMEYPRSKNKTLIFIVQIPAPAVIFPNMENFPIKILIEYNFYVFAAMYYIKAAYSVTFDIFRIFLFSF